MNDPLRQNQPNPVPQLPQDPHRGALEILRGMPQPPRDDTAKARARREHTALADVASPIPANPAEASLAVRHVATNRYANDCLLLAGQFRKTQRR